MDCRTHWNSLASSTSLSIEFWRNLIISNNFNWSDKKWMQKASFVALQIVKVAISPLNDRKVNLVDENTMLNKTISVLRNHYGTWSASQLAVSLPGRYLLRKLPEVFQLMHFLDGQKNQKESSDQLTTQSLQIFANSENLHVPYL